MCSKVVEFLGILMILSAALRKADCGCSASCSCDCDSTQCCSNGNQAPPTPGCPANFTFLSAANKCYRLITDKLSWDGARLRCQSLHSRSHSVVVNDQSEQEAIVGFFQSIDAIVVSQCYRAPWAAIWTAGQRIDFSGNTPFLWKPDNDTWKPMTYTNWNPGEPNNWGGAENCMHFLGYPSYTWNDFSCDENASYAGISGDMCVLCEIDME